MGCKTWDRRRNNWRIVAEASRLSPGAGRPSYDSYSCADPKFMEEPLFESFDTFCFLEIWSLRFGILRLCRAMKLRSGFLLERSGDQARFLGMGHAGGLRLGG